MNIRLGGFWAAFGLLVFSPLLAGAEAGAFRFTKVEDALLRQVELAEENYEEERLILHDAELQAYVTRVGQAMLPVEGAPARVQWRFFVIRDPMPNAFALPNGSIFVNTGLLSLLENEDQLASVLAHEITHVVDRHSYLANKDYRKKSAIANFVAFGAQFAPGSEWWGISLQVAGSLIPVIMAASIHGYRRDLEKHADIYSFNKLIEGGYDPREMPNVFRLLQRKDEVGVRKVYYNDHPKLEDRISYVTGLVIAKAPPPVPPELTSERRAKFLAITQDAVRRDIALAILANRPRTALARAKKLNEFNSQSADNQCALGNSYYGLGPRRPQPTEYELSKKGLKKARKFRKKFTFAEMERELMSSDNGMAAWKANIELAEAAYQEALLLEPNHAFTHRGLGELYEGTERNREALTSYEKYLELRPEAIDRFQIRGRIKKLKRTALPGRELIERQ